MAWTLFTVLSAKKAELDAALADDQVSRQSQKIRDAASLGGPSGTLYVLVEGADDAVKRAEELLATVGEKMPAPDGPNLYQRLKDEDEAAAAGMGLFFTE
jgi:hypothetical protein